MGITGTCLMSLALGTRSPAFQVLYSVLSYVSSVDITVKQMCLATAALIAATNESDLFGALDNSAISTACIAIFKVELLCCY